MLSRRPRTWPMLLGRPLLNLDRIAAGLRELDIENYDTEEDGTCLAAIL